MEGLTAALGGVSDLELRTVSWRELVGPCRRRLLAAHLFGLDLDAHIGTVDLVHVLVPVPVRTRAPLVVTVHDLIPMEMPWAYPPHAMPLYLNTLCQLDSAGGHFLANSQATAHALGARLGLQQSRVSWAHLGVSPRFAPSAPAVVDEMRAKYGLSGPSILATGALNPRKNLSRLIEAFGQCQRASAGGLELVLTGRTDRGESEVGRQARAVEGVRWLGYVPDEDMPGLLSAVDVCCYPSLAEGFGFPPLEAMACGTPVVCSDIPILRETAGSVPIFVDPMEPASIAAGLQRALDRTDEERAAGIEAGISWSSRFRWADTARATRSCYQKLL